MFGRAVNSSVRSPRDFDRRRVRRFRKGELQGLGPTLLPMTATNPPILLAIETSQRVGGVALRNRRTGAIDVEMLRAHKRHDDDLLPAINRLFHRLHCSPRDLKGGAVGVSIGPGGFTGLRIAVTTAKMLAETLDAQLLAVPSALVAAESLDRLSRNSNTPPSAPGSAPERSALEPAARLHARHSPGANRAGLVGILVALAAKDQSAWCTMLERNSDGLWTIRGAPGLADASSMNLTGVELVLANEHFPASMRSRCEQGNISIAEPTFDPAACLRVAERMLADARVIDALHLLPLYPRQPEAVTLWERRTREA
jgi:tRNA threonylcarbamoyl adenosine modification protein YeaZ